MKKPDTFCKDILFDGHRGHKSIRLPFEESEYEKLLSDCKYFKERLSYFISSYPDLFPAGIINGYQLWGRIPASEKQGIAVRRICIKNNDGKSEVYQIYPSFVMPYMTEMSEDAWKIMWLGQYGVPQWVLARVFNRDTKHVERLCRHLGNCSLVGSTVRSDIEVPKDLVVDEKHSRLDGGKAYIATIAAKECFLCAQVTGAADESELTQGYGQFAKEAEDVESGYRARTANTDGWKATINALMTVLGTQVAIIRCFLHALLSVRDVATKKTANVFALVKDKAWNIYKAKDKRVFAQRIRRLREMAVEITDIKIKEKVLKLCERKYSFMKAYDFDSAYRTSNMVDRMMDVMDKFLYNRKYLRGKNKTAQKAIKAFCISYNFRPYSPAVVKEQNVRSPFEKLNGFQYHDNWLQNMLVATSRNGYRKHQQKKT